VLARDVGDVEEGVVAASLPVDTPLLLTPPSVQAPLLFALSSLSWSTIIALFAVCW
jgi:hypothetical protein